MFFKQLACAAWDFSKEQTQCNTYGENAER